MIGHDDEFVQKIGRAAIVVQSIDQEPGPTFVAKEGSPLPRRRGDHVCLASIRSVLSVRSHDATSAAKAAIPFLPLMARLEGAPFQNSTNDGPGAEDQDFRDISAFGHLLSSTI